MEGKFHQTQYQDFKVAVIPEFDWRQTPVNAYLKPNEITYRVHKWGQNFIKRSNRGIDLEFRSEGHIATCNPFGPPDLLPKEVAENMGEPVLYKRGNFITNYDQWFTEACFTHGLIKFEELY